MQKYGELFMNELATLNAKIEKKIVELVVAHNLANSVVFNVPSIGNFVVCFSNDKKDSLMVVEYEYLKDPYLGGAYEMKDVMTSMDLIIMLNQVEDAIEKAVDEQ